MSLRNHNWLDVVKVLGKFGYAVTRQRGSHMILENSNGNMVPVPRHSPIRESTLKLILEQAEIPRGDFLKHV